MVTNMNVAKCSGAERSYKEGVVYALKTLNALGVYMYIDAGHAGWLGWPANLTPAAQLFADIYKNAGSPAFLRGLATNVANYNALSMFSSFFPVHSILIYPSRCLPRSRHPEQRQLR